MSRLCLFCIYLLLAALPLSARAQTSIAVVDVQALLAESDAAKSIEKQADEQKEKFLADVSRQEQALRDSEKSLSEQRESLSKDDFAKKAREFEERLIEMRRQAQTRKRAFEEASARAMGRLREKLYEVVQTIATEKGYNLVISKQNVVVGEQSIDITEEAMKRLNKVISNIPLEIQEPK